MSSQPNWRWCIKCRIIFFGGHPTKGKCPSGGEHLPVSNANFRLSFSTQKTPIFQDNWRWCQKCEGLFFHGNHSDGVCPAFGPHDATASGNYRIQFTHGLVIVAGINGLGHFLWCAKCEGMWLFISGTSLLGPFHTLDLGVCPAVGFHAGDGSGNYAIANA